MTEETLRQLIITLEKLATAAQSSATAQTAQTQAMQQQQGQKGSDFLNMQKSPVLSELKGLIDIDKILGSVVGGITSSITTGFTLFGRELVAPLTEAIKLTAKDIASGAQTAVETTYGPRVEARKILQDYAAAGKDVSDEQIEDLVGKLTTQGRAQREITYRANEIMGSSYTAMMETTFEAAYGTGNYSNSDYKRADQRRQKEIYDCWKLHGE